MNKSESYQPPVVVAEIGCNHMGQLTIAKELIDLARSSQARYAKFQKRNPKELLTEEQYNAPHPYQPYSYGETYGEHREFLEFTQDQHRELLDYCKEQGIGYASSVWDTTSAKEIIELNPDFIKVPSACNVHFEMLEILRDEYQGDIHISFGMTTEEEQDQIISFFSERNTLPRLVLYACTSGYPVPFEDVNLLEITSLKQQYGEKVKAIGFSGHHLGIAIDQAAFTLGATWIERHFTKNRTWKGTDHAASLEPGGLQKLVRDLAATHKALHFKPQQILAIEEAQRKKLKYRKS
ncbi:MAG: N-acetylneuraminate synthase [Cyclobacteriaceae bacterium]|nr:MAG: N-acetylneuraminate synthase [Cyclobacteriaceae bacterium]